MWTKVYKISAFYLHHTDGIQDIWFKLILTQPLE